jgi:hypothetical protein
VKKENHEPSGQNHVTVSKRKTCMSSFLEICIQQRACLFEERRGQLEILIHHTPKSHLLLSNVAVEKLDSESNQPSILYNNLTHSLLKYSTTTTTTHSFSSVID